jgi:hypothetical protein
MQRHQQKDGADQPLATSGNETDDVKESVELNESPLVNTAKPKPAIPLSVSSRQYGNDSYLSIRPQTDSLLPTTLGHKSWLGRAV